MWRPVQQVRAEERPEPGRADHQEQRHDPVDLAGEGVSYLQLDSLLYVRPQPAEELAASIAADNIVLDAANAIIEPLDAGIPKAPLAASPFAGPGRLEFGWAQTIEEEADRVAPGDILVTEMTDPGVDGPSFEPAAMTVALPADGEGRISTAARSSSATALVTSMSYSRVPVS